MKKALLSLFALVLTVGASAQVDPEDGGIYYLQNKESGQFLTRGSTWGTHAVTRPAAMPWKATLADGKITLRMYDITKAGENAKGLKNNFVDTASPTAFDLIYNDGDSTYSLKNGDNYLNAPATAGDINETADDSHWQFLTSATYDAIVAGRTAQQNAAAMKAAGINDEAELATWPSSDVPAGTPQSFTFEGCPNRGAKGDMGDNGMENFQGGGTYTKTFTGLTPGLYKVAVCAMKRIGSNEVCTTMAGEGYYPTDAFAQANGSVLPIKAWATDRASDTNPNSPAEVTAIVQNGGYTSEGYVTVGDDGVLTLSVTSEAYWNNSWFVFNSAKITYYANPAAQVDMDKLNALINEAFAMVSEGAWLNEEVYTTLGEVIQPIMDKMENEETITMDDYNALLNAVNNAKASIAAYQKAKEALDANEAFLNSTNFYTDDALQAYYEASGYTTARDAYEASTLTDADAKSVFNPYTITGWHGSTTASKLLLPAWQIDGVQCTDFTQGLYINTWSTEGEGDGTNFKVPFFEYWAPDGESLAAKTLTATLQGIAPGTYDITAWVRVRIKNNGGDDAQGITLQDVNVCDGEQTAGQFRLKEVTASATVADDGVLTVAFNVTEDNNISWLAFQNVRYAKNEIATAIDGVEHTANSQAHIYNVAGQRLSRLQKGLNIIGGKKVVVK